MPPETFKIVYLCVSVAGAAISFWQMRKVRENLLVLSIMTFVLAAVLLSFYFDSRRGYDIGPMMEYALHAFVAVQPDLMLTMSNVLLWGTVPFAVAIWLIRGKREKQLLWVFFSAVTLLKTLFEDQLIIHQYSKMLTHFFEWGYVLFDWGIIYALACFFLTKKKSNWTG